MAFVHARHWIAGMMMVWLWGCGGEAKRSPNPTTDVAPDHGTVAETFVPDWSSPPDAVDVEGGVKVDALGETEPLACKPEYECDDGDPCTRDDRCLEGGTICRGTHYECDDGLSCTREVCLGDGTCEHPLRNGRCLIDGVCYAEGQRNPQNGCQACITPQAVTVWSPDDTGTCDDGSVCTTDDHCYGGQCVGVAKRCDDGDPCTDDICVPDTAACTTAFNTAPCNDSNPCTVGDQCAAGQCLPGTESADCEDQNPCTRNWCDPTLGCQAELSDAPCDDGSACTTADHCALGQCTGTAVPCNDANPCTDDSCDPAVGCVHVANTAPCDDNAICTVGDQCADGQCVSGALANDTCDDGDPCTDDLCVPAVGCVHRYNHAPCETGDPCRGNDRCSNGVCIEGDDPVSCEDHNICTVDFCTPLVGCQHTPFDVACTDGNPCTMGDFCQDGQCQPGPDPLICQDNNLCTDDICDPLVGCRFVPNEAPCNDHNPCTTQDRCFWTVCMPGAVPFDCDDGDPCTDDFCLSGFGCQHTLNTAPCEDGNPCTLGDHCVQGDCVTGSAWNTCDDGNVCTDDQCNAGLGCQHTDNQAPCQDDSLCTINEYCAAGTCSVYEPVDCEDGNECTANFCEPATGCDAVVVADFDCRPQIVIDYPPRGATLSGDADIVVLGHVISPAGPVALFRVNNRQVTVDPQSGAFTYPMDSSWGMNLIIAEVTDIWEAKDRVVQSYYYSTGYLPLNSAQPEASMVPDALVLSLGQELFDNGDASDMTLANLFSTSLANLNFDALIPSPATSGSAGWCDYSVYISNISFAPPVVDIYIRDDGIYIDVLLANFYADIYVDMDGFLCPSVSGHASAQQARVTMKVVLTIGADGLAHAELQDQHVEVLGLNISMGSGILGAILDAVIGIFEEDIVNMIEDEVSNQLQTLPQILEDTINSFALNQAFEVPPLFPGMTPATLQLSSRLTGVRYLANSAVILSLRAGVMTDKGTPYEPLGSILRMKCLDPSEPALEFASGFDLQVAVAMDFLNQLLYGVYWSGVTELAITAEDLGDIALPDGMENLSVRVSMMLPPILNTCHRYESYFMQVGDIRVDAEFDMFGMHVVVTLYASAELSAELSLADADDGKAIQLQINDVRIMEIEVASLNEELLGSEDMVSVLLEQQLMPALLDMVGGLNIAFALPSIDLHALAPDFIPEGVQLHLDPASLVDTVGYILMSSNL